MKRNYNNITGHGKSYALSNNSLFGKTNRDISLTRNQMPGFNTTSKSRSISNICSSYLIINRNISPEIHSVINKTPAIKLAKTVLRNLDINSLRSDSKIIFKNDFYSPCIFELTDSALFNEINDIELLLLFFKQLVMIIKESGIIEKKNDYMAENFSSVYSFKLYVNLFDSFWNKVTWKKLFPSMPDFAASIYSRRRLIIDLMLQEDKKQFRIDKICNSFLDITGLGRSNDLYLISFFDFYLFTWLSHFGLIRYLKGDDLEPVKIELTHQGRNLFQYLPI